MLNYHHFCRGDLTKWGAVTLSDFVLGGLSFQGESPMSDLWWQWRLSSHLFVEGIVWKLDLMQD
jgi:hypothetical protein